MRNYDEEIEQLRREIEDLELEKQDKETQLQRVLRERKTKRFTEEEPENRRQIGKSHFNRQ